MGIATLADYKAALKQPHQKIVASRNVTYLASVDSWTSLWQSGGTGGTGAAPATTRACSSATLGAIAQWPTPAAGFYLRPIAYTLMPCGFNRTATGTSLALFDRLVDHAGCVANVATAQSTNFPTAALPRETSGYGVWPFIEVYGAIGSTTTTVTISYTNQDGVSGRTSLPQTIGGSFRNGAQNLIPIPLQDGDTGVRSVQSMTLAATTGTAGNIGIVLAKPWVLLSCKLHQGWGVDLMRGMREAPILPDSACLWAAMPSLGGTTFSTSPVGFSLSFARTDT